MLLYCSIVCLLLCVCSMCKKQINMKERLHLWNSSTSVVHVTVGGCRRSHHQTVSLKCNELTTKMNCQATRSTIYGVGGDVNQHSLKCYPAQKECRWASSSQFCFLNLHVELRSVHLPLSGEFLAFVGRTEGGVRNGALEECSRDLEECSRNVISEQPKEREISWFWNGDSVSEKPTTFLEDR